MKDSALCDVTLPGRGTATVRNTAVCVCLRDTPRLVGAGGGLVLACGPFVHPSNYTNLSSTPQHERELIFPPEIDQTARADSGGDCRRRARVCRPSCCFPGSPSVVMETHVRFTPVCGLGQFLKTLIARYCLAEYKNR